MKGIRRKEKAITNQSEMIEILMQAQYVTIAMCMENQPYLVTLSHGYDSENNCIYFHCAKEGKKIDILSANNLIWGQAIVDKGYVQGACDHLYATTQFRGQVSFIDDIDEKRHALRLMIESLDENPETVYSKQVTNDSAKKVNIGRIDIDYMSGKKSTEVIISM